MNITFTSEIKHSQDKQDKIEFTAPVTTREERGMRVFEFAEPQNNVMNWIEVSENHVNIITGPTTINMALNENKAVEYSTEAGTIYFNSYMSSCEIADDVIKFSYTLSQGQNLIGEYKITLALSK